MSIPTQHKYLTRFPTHVPKYHHLCLPRPVICSATTTTKSKPKPTQVLTYTKRGQPFTSLCTSVAPPVPSDSSLQSTWSHRIWVATRCTSNRRFTVSKNYEPEPNRRRTVSVRFEVGSGFDRFQFGFDRTVATPNSHIWLQPILAGYIGYILADLGSGIEAFQGHHKWPWTITRCQFANNLHAITRAVTFCVSPTDLACNGPTFHGLVGLPPLVAALQDLGLLVSRAQHTAHHRPPYNNSYCTANGVWNEFLDKQKAFETLEMVLYFQLGVRPRSWCEPTSDRAEEVEAPSQVAV
ncbi:hypothetical protein P3X46_006645 [Hevea brasiliensis]|uniref:Lipid desaturase domain-containing protein n=1 Tax=Hevea brasiliensis TaxID=3981 RepID=A0ABQ9MUZ8_HEVBR|nr:hypothetical protein P3X46_006645 [Hevea brasiliensis]